MVENLFEGKKGEQKNERWSVYIWNGLVWRRMFMAGEQHCCKNGRIFCRPEVKS